jgi:hypothetical protein
MFIEYMNEKNETAVKLTARVPQFKQVFRPYTAEMFECKCGCGKKLIEPYWVDFMNFLYNRTQVMYKVTSGIRCEKYNKKVGGKDYYKGTEHILSDHVMSMAIDIDYSSIDERSQIVYYAFKYGVPRAIVYTGKKTFVHLSTNDKLTTPLLIFNLNGKIV